MSDSSRLETDYLSASESLHQLLVYLFSQLTVEEVEQFYQGYHSWQLQQNIETIRGQIERIRQQITENEQQMQRITPSTIALATVARLQSQGVSDIDLLDRMMERGEDWLDHTMQLLDYCERLGIIYGDYTQWCEHALEGAYDWITSIADNDSFATTQEASPSNDELFKTGITEEMLLRKFMNEQDEEINGDVSEQSEKPIEVEELAFENTDVTDDASTPDKDDNHNDDNDDDDDDNSPNTDPGSSHDALSENSEEETASVANKEDMPEAPEPVESAAHVREREQQMASRANSPSHVRTVHRRLKEQVAHHTRREAVIAGQSTRGMIPNHAANWPAYM